MKQYISVAKVFDAIRKNGIDDMDMRYLLSMAIDQLPTIDTELVRVCYGTRGVETIEKFQREMPLD